VAVAVVGELVVAGGELLQALCGDGGEVAGELGVLGQHHGAPRHERVDQRLLPHRLGSTPAPAHLLLLLPRAEDGGEEGGRWAPPAPARRPQGHRRVAPPPPPRAGRGERGGGGGE